MTNPKPVEPPTGIAVLEASTSALSHLLPAHHRLVISKDMKSDQTTVASEVRPGASRGSGLCLPADTTIALAVIAGSSKGLTHRLSRPQISIGHSTGGADIEIDDPDASPIHCALGVNGDVIRLCDLDSQSGTYVNEKRIQACELRHLSEFRIGSSVFLVVIHREGHSTR